MAANDDAELVSLPKKSSFHNFYLKPSEVAEIVKRLKASKAKEKALLDDWSGYEDGFEWAATKATYSDLQEVVALDHQAEEISFMAYLELPDTIDDASDAYARGFIVGAKHVWDQVGHECSLLESSSAVSAKERPRRVRHGPSDHEPCSDASKS